MLSFGKKRERIELVSNGTRSPPDGQFYRNLQNFLANEKNKRLVVFTTVKKETNGMF